MKLTPNQPFTDFVSEHDPTLFAEIEALTPEEDAQFHKTMISTEVVFILFGIVITADRQIVEPPLVKTGWEGFAPRVSDLGERLHRMRMDFRHHVSGLKPVPSR